MASTIYYFSGTGNSLAAARMVNEKLAEESEIIPIPAVDGNPGIKSDRVGIFFPVYCHRVPDIVKRFIEKMEFQSSPYLYAVATHGGEVGQSLFDVQELLGKKGQTLSLGIEIFMPGNATPVEPHVERVQLSALGQKAAEIAGLIEKQEKCPMEGVNSFIEHIRNRLIGFVAWNYVFDPKRFKISNDCTGCGTCVKVCPVKNIQTKNHKPVWGKHCTACLACFHWCPKEAVYMDNFHIGKRRKYHHPDITLEDMIIGTRQ